MSVTRPVAVDLFCGRGGWTKGFLAEGYAVIGVDIVRYDDYPADAAFLQADIDAILFGSAFRDASVIVASPPCQEFSRWDQPWTRKRNPPQPDLSLVKASRRIAREAGVPLILENVRGAQRFIGPAGAHFGAFYLWGDVPALLPKFHPGDFRKKESYGSKDVSRRAEIPLQLSRWIARCFLPVAQEVGA